MRIDLSRLHPSKRPIHSFQKFMAHTLTGTVHDLRDLDWRYGIPLLVLIISALSVIVYYSGHPKLEWVAPHIANEAHNVRSSDHPATAPVDADGLVYHGNLSGDADCSDVCSVGVGRVLSQPPH